MLRSTPLPTPWAIHLLLMLWLVQASPVRAEGFRVTDARDNEIAVEVLPAEGDLLAVWFLDHEDPRPMFDGMLRALQGAGVEVWRVDLVADYFLPRTNENVRTLPGDGVAAVIRAAQARSAKPFVVAAYDRMPLPLLRGVRQFQTDHPGPSRLAGALLYYPNLFGPPPVAGREPELDPVVAATNVPVTLIQPERGSHRWRLPEVMRAFWQGGSPAFVQLVPGVRDWFFMHPPDRDPAERVATDRVPAELIRLAGLMAAQPRAGTPPPLAEKAAPASQVRGLVELAEGTAAPELELPELDGGIVRLSDYRGRVTLVNFWATWCPPCVEELPSLNDLGSHYRGRPFELVSIDFRESDADVRAFMERVPVEFPVLMDRNGRVSRDWRVFAFPSSFLLDRQGRIRYSVNRGIDWDAPEVYAVVERLLAEPDAVR